MVLTNDRKKTWICSAYSRLIFPFNVQCLHLSPLVVVLCSCALVYLEFPFPENTCLCTVCHNGHKYTSVILFGYSSLHVIPKFLTCYSKPSKTKVIHVDYEPMVDLLAKIDVLCVVFCFPSNIICVVIFEAIIILDPKISPLFFACLTSICFSSNHIILEHLGGNKEENLNMSLLG